MSGHRACFVRPLGCSNQCHAVVLTDLLYCLPLYCTVLPCTVLPTSQVHEIVKGIFSKDPSRGVNPDEVVAMGAAIQVRGLGH